MVSPETQSTVKSWLTSMRETLRLDEIAEKLHISGDTLSFSIIYFITGLISGFLYKRFGRQLIIAIVASIVLLWVLSYIDLISLHTDTLKALAGVSTTDTVGSVFEAIGMWVKQNIIQVIVGLIGFYLGSKVG